MVEIASVEDKVMTRILIVEDDPLTQQLLSGFLKRAGCESMLTNDGIEALNLLAQDDHFDAIVSDIRMPKMDGFRLLDEVAAIYPHIPVIISSVDMSAAIVDEVMKRGVSFLPRPFTLEALKAALRVASV